MHPADNAWQALGDGELSAVPAHALRQHRDGCARCQQRCSELETAQRECGALLAVLDAPMPSVDVNVVIWLAQARREASAWRSIAAAVAIVLIGAAATVAAASPLVWQMIARAWQTVVSTPRPVGSPNVGPTVGETTPQPVGIAIEPRGAVRIAFQAVQVGGEIRIALTNDSGKVSVVANRSVPYSVRSTTVVISNAGTDATYDIVIPRNSPQATVLVAGEEVFVKDGWRVSTHLAGVGQADRYVLPFSAFDATKRGVR